MKKLTFLLLLLLFITASFAQSKVNRMPIFPNCDTTVSDEEIKKCTEQNLLKYVNKNLVYPSVARENGITGMVVVRYSVTETGEIANIAIIKSIGGGCDEEAIRIIKSMNDNLDNWIPGMKDGKPISVAYNLPIRFKLASHSPNTSTLDGEPVYEMVEKKPSLAQCANETLQENCTDQRIIEYILKHFEYPERSINKRVKGFAQIEIIIAKSGKTRSTSTKGGLDVYCQKELIRVIEKMNRGNNIKWLPAKQSGKAVHAKYSLAIDLNSLNELRKTKRKELKALKKN